MMGIQLMTYGLQLVTQVQSRILLTLWWVHRGNLVLLELLQEELVNLAATIFKMFFKQIVIPNLMKLIVNQDMISFPIFRMTFFQNILE